MTGNKRRFTRIEVPMPINLAHPDHGTISLQSMDISDGGVFLKADTDLCLPLGSEVILQVKAGLLAGDDPPKVRAVVVRVTDDGMGLRFV